jgi:signal transduction histidine kinase
MPAQTIDEVILRLEQIISDAITTGNRAGYFAALYHKVTCRVKEGIAIGEFQDGPRMEKLDVVFANRYIAAYDAWTAKNKAAVSLSWQIAFTQLQKRSVLVLQHLLLGMNAHINLDLGIAVVEIAKELNTPLQQIHQDFNSINTILAALSYEVINELDRISPLLSLLGKHSGNNSLLIQFALSNARDGAWCFAEDLYNNGNTIASRDQDIHKLGGSIVTTQGFIRFTVLIIHLFELKSPSRITSILRNYQKTYIKVH